MAAEIDVSAPWSHPDAAEWDRQTFDDWVLRNAANDDVRDLLLCYTQAAFGSDGRDFSLLFLVWYIAASGNEKNVGTFERSSGSRDAAQDSRFVGGSQLRAAPARPAARGPGRPQRPGAVDPPERAPRRRTHRPGHRAGRRGSWWPARRRPSWASTGSRCCRSAGRGCCSGCRWARS